MSEEQVGIVGAGPLGLALAAMLGRAERRSLVWSPQSQLVQELAETRKCAALPGLELPEQVTLTSDPEELAAGARFLLVATSALDVQAHLTALGASVGGNHIAVHAIGSFGSPNDQRVSELISRSTPILRTGVLAGPLMANFLAAGHPASLLCASEFDEVTQECRRLLAIPAVLRLYRGRDLVGAELASALSMAYTISIGLADALGVDISIRAVLITRIVSEMARLGTAAGADAKTFYGLAGLGNLLVRTSIAGKQVAPSYQLGRDLVGTSKVDLLSEPAHATQAALGLARSLGQSLPVLETTGKVLVGELEPKQVVGQLLAVATEAE